MHHAAKLLASQKVRHQVVKCKRFLVAKLEDVSVCADSVGRVFYRNLMSCGSVWTCAVCSSQISEVRRVEVTEAARRWQENFNGENGLLTLTVPHEKFHSLETLDDRFKLALVNLKRGRAYMALKKKFGIAYSIRDSEVTHRDEHGWHPHVHELLFLKRRLSVTEQADLHEELFVLWKAAACAAGFKAPSKKHGVDLGFHSAAALYVSKWGMSHEVSKWHLKKGKNPNSGRTPFQLLSDSLNGDEDAGKLFKEFAAAYKGKRQLFWSPGLRKALQLDADKTDQEIVDESDHPEKERSPLGKFSPFEFSVIARHRLQGPILEVAARGGWKDVVDFIFWTCGMDLRFVERQLPAGAKDEEV